MIGKGSTMPRSNYAVWQGKVSARKSVGDAIIVKSGYLAERDKYLALW